MAVNYEFMGYLKGSILLYDKHNDSCGALRSTTEQVEMEAAKFAKSGTECVRVCVRERKKIDAERPRVIFISQPPPPYVTVT